MGKGRLEAFSDGVIAIIITIMVLELKVAARRGPGHADAPDSGLHQLRAQLRLRGDLLEQPSPHAARVQDVNGSILWANTHLLFWLSLVPFVTGWMGENHFAPSPVALYGFVMLMAGLAYTVLARVLVHRHGPDSPLATALGEDVKGRLSLVIYASAIPLAFVNRWISLALYFVVAVMWLIPDRRIERILTSTE